LEERRGKKADNGQIRHSPGRVEAEDRDMYVLSSSSSSSSVCLFLSPFPL
jgi:hypothetical protein